MLRNFHKDIFLFRDLFFIYFQHFQDGARNSSSFCWTGVDLLVLKASVYFGFVVGDNS